MGQPDVARAMLARALEKDPTLLQARIFLSHALLVLADPAGAERVIDDAKRRHPQQASWLAEGFARMKADVASSPPSAAGPDPHAALAADSRAPSGLAAGNPHQRPGADAGVANAHAEAAGSPGPAAELAALERDGRGIDGTIELAAGLQGRLSAGAAVFLTVREAGAKAGPPIAAKRLAPSFPARFHIDQADSMTGAQLPERVAVEARVDDDGDASTREAADPIARVEGVRLGSRELRLVLARP
jgi:hypothetical protein